MTKIDEALTATLADLIRNVTMCGCCDSDGNHLAIVKRALQRTPVDWWPNAAIIPTKTYRTIRLYEPIYRALTERRITWEPVDEWRD